MLVHVLAAAILLLAGWQWGQHQLLLSNELLNIMTMQQMVRSGTFYLSAAQVEFFERYDTILIRDAAGRYFGKDNVANLVVPALFWSMAPDALVFNQLPWLVLLLYLLRRLQRAWQQPDAAYFFAAGFALFGSVTTPYLFSYFQYVQLGVLLVVQVFFQEQFLMAPQSPAGRRGLLVALLALMAAVLMKPEAAVNTALTTLILLIPAWRRHDRRTFLTTVLAVGTAVAFAAGYTMALNYIKSGNIIDNGAHCFFWSLDGWWRGWLTIGDNLLVACPLLLALPLVNRRAAPYLWAAFFAWALYASWFAWNDGYHRFYATAMLALTPALLLMPRRTGTVLLLMLGILLNSAYLVLPFYDTHDVMYVQYNPGSYELKPLLGVIYLWQLVRGNLFPLTGIY